MNREKIEDLATYAGAYTPTNNANDWAFELPDLLRFAALVAAHEREQCARVCKEIAESGRLIFEEITANACADGIRKRGQDA